jgi:hypothetical protein
MRIAGTFGVLAVLLTSSNNVTRWFRPVAGGLHDPDIHPAGTETLSAGH